MKSNRQLKGVYVETFAPTYPLEVQVFLCPEGECESQKLRRKQTQMNKRGTKLTVSLSNCQYLLGYYLIKRNHRLHLAVRHKESQRVQL